MIESDLEIKSCYLDQDDEIRYWEIEGFGKCGGTHLRRTGKIKEIISLKLYLMPYCVIVCNLWGIVRLTSITKNRYNCSRQKQISIFLQSTLSPQGIVL